MDAFPCMRAGPPSGNFICIPSSAPDCWWHRGAGLREVQLEDGRRRVLTGTMSCEPWQSSNWRTGSAERMAHAVDACRVILAFFSWASGAVGRRPIWRRGQVP